MKLKNKKHISSADTRIVEVINDGLIYQHNFCDGKAIPNLIINTELYPEINRSIELHRDVKEGEIECTWAISTDKKFIFLILNSLAPVEISYVIQFDLKRHYSIINRILSVQLVYIQAGKKGDKIINTREQYKLLLEIPATGFENEWTKIYRKMQEKDFKKLGVKRKDLSGVIETFNAEWESVVNKHFK